MRLVASKHGHAFLAFQSTHPRGVRLYSRRSGGCRRNFNPRTHVGCDSRSCSPSNSSFRHFNPRTHVGCDLMPIISEPIQVYFNPRTHVGCDSRPNGWRTGRWIFQSTHPRGVRQVFQDEVGWARVFQSTHPRGVRHSTSTGSRHRRYFNPRTHVGCDFNLKPGSAPVKNFNPRTHVGCDGRNCDTGGSVFDFNPRTHVGCDAYVLLWAWQLPQFQSTHPRGVRPNDLPSPLLIRYFNPRTHVGCDISFFNLIGCNIISIHAPTWGATSFLPVFSFLVIFQSTHPRGVRPGINRLITDILKFQSTHPRGVRLFQGRQPLNLLEFQSTHPRGVRPQ